MSRHGDDDYDVEAGLRRRRNRQPTDDTIEIVLRLDSEQAYSEDEQEPNLRRGRYEGKDDDVELQRRCNRRDDSIERDRERVYYGDEEELDMPRRRYEDDDDADLRWRRRRQQSDDSVETIQRRDSGEKLNPPRRRGGRSDSVTIDPELGLVIRQGVNEYYPRQRSPSVSRRRRNDSYRAPYYDDYYDSDDRRSPSPPRVYRRRFSRARDSLSSLSDTPPPPRGYRPRYREVSPPVYRRTTIVPERSFERSRSRSSYSSSGEGTVQSQFPKKGKTRIPARIVSKRAIIDLGYPFEEEVCISFQISNVSLTPSRVM
jgi:hypothetical protein